MAGNPTETINLNTGEIETGFDDLSSTIVPVNESRVVETINLDTGAIIQEAPAIHVDTKEDPQERALRLGAQPGIALTEEQKLAIQRGEQITPEPSLLEGREFQQRPPVDKNQSPFGRSVEQGLLNIGGGVLRSVGELRRVLGDDEARQFLSDLAVSQTMELGETAQVTEDAPVQRFAGEVTGETLGFPFGGAGKSLLTKLLTGGIAGGTAGALSAAGRGEEGADIAFEAGLGAGLAPAAELGISRLRARGAAKKARQVGDVQAEEGVIGEAAKQIERAQASQEATGVRLLPAQQTLNPFQLEKQAFLGQNPEVSTKAFNVLKDQNKEAAAAVSSLLDVIGEPKAVGTAGARARRASEGIVDAARLLRSEKASPLYRDAFREGASVNVKPVQTTIDDILSGLPPEGGKIRSAVLKTRELLKGNRKINKKTGKIEIVSGVPGDIRAQHAATEVAPPGHVHSAPVSRGKPSLEQLHGAKIEIDEMLNMRGESGVGPTTKRYLTQIQKSLVTQMRDASPQYAGAMDEFRRLSPAVDELRDGIFGRIQGLKDTDLKRASGILFDASENNPAVLKNALKSLKNVEGGQQLAQDLLRTEIEKRLGRIRIDLTEAAETGGRKLENVPQLLLNNFFGNAAQRKLLFTGLNELSPAAGKNALWLEDALSRAASGRPGGSQTGIRAVISDQLRGASLAFRNFFRKPLDSLVGIGEEQQFSRKVRAIGDALYNPDWRPDMNKIRKLNPNSPEAASRFEKLLTSIVEQNELTGASTQAIATAGRKELLGEDQQ